MNNMNNMNRKIYHKIINKTIFYDIKYDNYKLYDTIFRIEIYALLDVKIKNV